MSDPLSLADERTQEFLDSIPDEPNWITDEKFVPEVRVYLSDMAYIAKESRTHTPTIQSIAVDSIFRVSPGNEKESIREAFEFYLVRRTTAD